MSLSVRTRFEVFKRDRFTCAYCGNHPPDVLLECDHIVPIAAGGSDAMENLVTSCRDCNAGKSDRLLDEGTAPAFNQASLDAMQERLDQAKAYMETLAGLQAITDDMVNRVRVAWGQAFGAKLEEQPDGAYWKFPPDTGVFPSKASIKRILRDLPMEDVMYAIDETAVRKDAEHYWPTESTCRYFYAICRNLAWARDRVSRG